MSGTSCSGNMKDEFSNAKSHYNPNNCIHPFHIGDLPPLIENSGYAYMNVLIQKFNIKEIIGKAVIIHDMPDDFATQPSRKFRNKNCLWKNRVISIFHSQFHNICNDIFSFLYLLAKTLDLILVLQMLYI